MLVMIILSPMILVIMTLLAILTLDIPTNCLSVFDHFVGLALKGLREDFNSCHAKCLGELQNFEDSFLKKLSNLQQNLINSKKWKMMRNMSFQREYLIGLITQINSHGTKNTTEEG